MPEENSRQQGGAPISEEQIRQALNELDDIQTSSESLNQDYSSAAGTGIDPTFSIILGVILLGIAVLVAVVLWRVIRKARKQG